MMSGGKPVSLSVMCSPKAHLRWGSVHNLASLRREETSFSRRARTLAQAGPGRMACWNVSGPVPRRGQVRSGFSSNQEGWAAR